MHQIIEQRRRNRDDHVASRLLRPELDQILFEIDTPSRQPSQVAQALTGVEPAQHEAAPFTLDVCEQLLEFAFLERATTGGTGFAAFI